MTKIKLYDCFKHWQNKGVIWILSDTHFNDSDCKLMDEHWPLPEEQVNIINSFVGKKDTFVCLGDVGDEEFVKKIKGYKVLLTGNHDKGVSNYKKKYILQSVIPPADRIDMNEKPVNLKEFDSFEEATAYKDILAAKDFQGMYRVIDNRLFDEVYEGPVFISDKILLSHEPVELGFGYNIHGHVHSGRQEYIGEDYAMFNLAADVVGYKPVRLDELIEKTKVIDLHRCIIDLATERAREKENKER